METGTVVSWAKNEGDQVSEGDLLAEIETDKATMGLDASDDGYVAKIFAAAGTKNLPVGTPLCIIVEDQESVAAFANYQPEASAPAAPAAAAPPPPAAVAPTPTPAAQLPAAATPTRSAQAAGGRVFISPMAKRLAEERGLDVSRLGPGSGVDGSITVADLDKAPSPGFGVPGVAAGAGFVDLPLTGMRSTIARRLAESKQTIPHFYLTVDVEIDQLLSMRKGFNEMLAKSNPNKDAKPMKISINDIFVKAMAVASKCVPPCNSAWHGDFIRQYNSVDICVAVSTPDGLITPIVFGADSKGVLQISNEVTDLATRAKQNKLKPQEFQGGTMTISNLGMFGMDSFSAIINPPQSCILAVGAAKKVVIPDSHSAAGYKTATTVSMTLCCDHRVVDGAAGALWLSEFKKYVEEPARMLL